MATLVGTARVLSRLGPARRFLAALSRIRVFRLPTLAEAAEFVIECFGSFHFRGIEPTQHGGVRRALYAPRWRQDRPACRGRPRAHEGRSFRARPIRACRFFRRHFVRWQPPDHVAGAGSKTGIILNFVAYSDLARHNCQAPSERSLRIPGSAHLSIDLLRTYAR